MQAHEQRSTNLLYLALTGALSGLGTRGACVVSGGCPCALPDDGGAVRAMGCV
jgi:hypothetical protein